jgi:hypothetical protein
MFPTAAANDVSAGIGTNRSPMSLRSSGLRYFYSARSFRMTASGLSIGAPTSFKVLVS